MRTHWRKPARHEYQTN